MKDPILPPEPLPISPAAVDGTGRAPTPGLSLAGLRHPAQPTLPEWDPASLSLVVQRLANDLFQSPGGGGPPGEGQLASGQAPHIAPLDMSPQSVATSGPFPTSAGVPNTDLWGPSLPAPNAVPVASLSQPVPAAPTSTVPVSSSSTTPPAPAAATTTPAPTAATSTPSAAPSSALVAPGITPVIESAAPVENERAGSMPSTQAPPVESAVRGATPVSHHGPSTPSAPDASTLGGVGGMSPANPFAVAPSFAFLDEGVMRAPIVDERHLRDGSARDSSARDRRDERDWRAGGGGVRDPLTATERHEPVLNLPKSGGLEPLIPWQRQGFDAYAIREEFPILKERVHGGKRLVWLDNAATTQKPQAVIDRLSYFYEHENSNIHRAAHALAARATDAYESAREAVKKFINAGDKNNIVFVRGTTEGINLIAQTWGKKNIVEGDEILLTNLEHHANIVPWQMLANEKGAKLKVAPVDDDGQIILSEFERLLGPKVKLVAMPQVSNALGTITPAKEMISVAHRYGAKVVLDGAQSVSHMKVDVQALDCDFFVFSGHKIFAPTGIGAVYGKPEMLEASPPYQGGGNMIQDVTFERTVYQAPPARFEAGTGNIADAVGLGAALDWVTRVGIENIDRHEHELLVYATDRLRHVPGLRIYGTARDKAGVISFTLAGHTTADVAAALDKEGIAVRGGHHCAQPILRRFGLESSVRASFAPYNVREDVDALVEALERIQANSGVRS